MVFGGGASGMWLGYEGGAFMNGIPAFIKEASESSPTPYAKWGHSTKKAACEPRGKSYSDTKFASALDLGFPSSRRMRNKFMLFVSYSIYGILLE